MKVLLVTPPFTQLNTPYPATSYLKGYLSSVGIEARQADLSLETILKIFSPEGLATIFDWLEANEADLSENGFRIFSQRKAYLRTIGPVLAFLQNRDHGLAFVICRRDYLPEASRFVHIEANLPGFGELGIHDKARYFSTLYLEDLGDLITESVDPFFGFSRYAERLGRTASSFDDLYGSLTGDDTFVTTTMLELLDDRMAEHCPGLVCLTVPFPGNVFAAFRCARHIKENYKGVRVAIGGGYVNTELRSVYDERVFEFVDFITLDDGEAPLRILIEYLEGKRPQNKLKRTFMLSEVGVIYIDGAPEKDVAQRDTGTPDLDGLLLNSYLSVIELANPMHRLWSDGRWNKLTLAHGCYWGKCSFCDVTLDYIERYEPVPAAEICDRMAKMIRQSGQTGFHFVDEAAPPALMRDVSIELIRRDMAVSWWTNIRFEKSFTSDLCRLLAASGCIAVSGGLEVASDRLLDLMKKGVTVAQVARVARAFEDAGIMVHAYLMYGFPTQTDQETIDSLETVRQMFEAGVIRSGFWHLFAMTAHSPVGLEPAVYSVVAEGPDFGGFADNDRYHSDPAGADHDKYSEGLRVSLLNYMQGHGIDWPLGDWFDFEIPDTTLQPGSIAAFIKEDVLQPWRPTNRIVWTGGEPVELILPKGKKKKESDKTVMAEIVVSGVRGMHSLFFTTEEKAMWAIEVMEKSSGIHAGELTAGELQKSFQESCPDNFEAFAHSEEFRRWREAGLLLV